MWWYNIIVYNQGIISHILRLDPTTVVYFLLASNLIFLKSEYPEPNLTVKRIEWSKLIYSFIMTKY